MHTFCKIKPCLNVISIKKYLDALKDIISKCGDVISLVKKTKISKTVGGGGNNNDDGKYYIYLHKFEK